MEGGPGSSLDKRLRRTDDHLNGARGNVTWLVEEGTKLEENRKGWTE